MKYIDVPFTRILQAKPYYVHFMWNNVKKKKAVCITDSSSGTVWLTGNAGPEAAQQVDDIHVGTAKAGCARVGEM